VSEVTVEEFRETLVHEEAFLPQLCDDEQEEVVRLLNSKIFGRTGLHDIFGLVLVMLGIRPACIVTSTKYALTENIATDMVTEQAAVASYDLFGQFLEHYEIPYILSSHHSEGSPVNPAQVSLNFHISFDEGRLSTFAAAQSNAPSDRSDGMPGLPREMDEALGEFLAYPEPAVEAYVEREHMTGKNEVGNLLEELSDEELQTELSVIAEFYDAPELDFREFTRLLIPYVVPTTVPECIDNITRDVVRFMIGGLIAAEDYDITIFSQVLQDYRERFAPNS